MAVEEAPRRSGRARKQIKTLAEEQAEAVAASQPARKKRKVAPSITLHPGDHDRADSLVRDETAHTDIKDEQLSDFDSTANISATVHSPPETLSLPKKRKATRKKSTAKNGGQPYGAPAEGTMIPW